MVAYKSSAVANFVKAPTPECRAVLVYGPDAGLVAERASALAQMFARRSGGQTEVVRLDDRDLGEDPARLEVELRTAPMFAAQSVIQSHRRAQARSDFTQGVARDRVRQSA